MGVFVGVGVCVCQHVFNAAAITIEKNDRNNNNNKKKKKKKKKKNYSNNNNEPEARGEEEVDGARVTRFRPILK